MDIIDRFQQSLTQYNRAKGLIEKGRNDEAEELLNAALSTYPREALMGDAGGADNVLLSSYETLFTDIKVQLEVLRETKEAEPSEPVPEYAPADNSRDIDIEEPYEEEPASSAAYVSLKDIMFRNMRSGSVPGTPPDESSPAPRPARPVSADSGPELEILSPADLDLPSGGDNFELNIEDIEIPQSDPSSVLDPRILVDELAQLEADELANPSAGTAMPDTADVGDEIHMNDIAGASMRVGSDDETGAEPSAAESVGETTQERKMPQDDSGMPDLDAIDFDALEREASGEPVESAQPEPEAAAPAEEARSTPAPEEPSMPSPKPFAPAAADHSDEEEALVPEEEPAEEAVEEEGKKKKRRERKPIKLPDLSRLVGAILVLIGIAAVCASAQLAWQELMKSTEISNMVSKADGLAKTGNYPAAAQIMASLKTRPEWAGEAGSEAVAGMIAGWSDDLAKAKKDAAAQQLIMMGLAGGEKSRSLAEAYMELTLAQYELTGTVKPEKLRNDLNLASRAMMGVTVNQQLAGRFNHEMAKIAHETFSAQAKQSLASGDAAGAMAAVRNLETMKSELSPEQQAALNSLSAAATKLAAKNAEAAKKAEAARLAEEAKKAEVAKKAEAAILAEEAKKAEAAKQAEAAKKAAPAKVAPQKAPEKTPAATVNKTATDIKIDAGGKH